MNTITITVITIVLFLGYTLMFHQMPGLGGMIGLAIVGALIGTVVGNVSKQNSDKSQDKLIGEKETLNQ